MNIEIRYTEDITENVSNDIKELSNTIVRNCETQVEAIIQSPEKGQKDAGLILGLTIASFALSSIDTLINVLNYWQSKQTKYSVSFSVDGKEYSLEARSLNDLKEALSELPDQKNSKMAVSIKK